MGIPIIFVLFLIFLVVFQYHLKKSDMQTLKARRKFWENEEKSRFTRKKDIPDTYLIKTHVDTLPRYSPEDFKTFQAEKLYQIQESCFALAEKPMMNLQNLSNSEISLQYGPANIGIVQEQENHYNQYIRLLYRLGKGYYEINRLEDARKILEEGIAVRTDISDHIILIAKLYCDTNDLMKFNHINEIALSLTSMTKDKVILQLNQLRAAHF